MNLIFDLILPNTKVVLVRDVLFDFLEEMITPITIDHFLEHLDVVNQNNRESMSSVLVNKQGEQTDSPLLLSYQGSRQEYLVLAFRYNYELLGGKSYKGLGYRSILSDSASSYTIDLAGLRVVEDGDTHTSEQVEPVTRFEIRQISDDRVELQAYRYKFLVLDPILVKLKRRLQKLYADTVSQTDQKSRREPRLDALQRVAVAIYTYELRIAPSLTAASKRVGIDMATIRKYESHERVIEYLQVFREEYEKSKVPKVSREFEITKKLLLNQRQHRLRKDNPS